MSKIRFFYAAGVLHQVEKTGDGFIVSWQQSQRCFRGTANREYTKVFKTEPMLKGWFRIKQERFDRERLIAAAKNFSLVKTEYRPQYLTDLGLSLEELQAANEKYNLNLNL